jgi:hypothetical protein
MIVTTEGRLTSTLGSGGGLNVKIMGHVVVDTSIPNNVVILHLDLLLTLVYLSDILQ